MRGHLVPFVTSMAESVDTYKGRCVAGRGEQGRGTGEGNRGGVFVLMICMVVFVRLCRPSRLYNAGTKHTAGGGGIVIFMHGRSRMTIDPCIPTMPGRTTSGFHPSGRRRLHPSAKRRKAFGESHEGHVQ